LSTTRRNKAVGDASLKVNDQMYENGEANAQRAHEINLNVIKMMKKEKKI